MPEVLTQVDPDDSIEKLSGRELDAAVHRLVMGHALIETHSGDLCWQREDGWTHDGGLQWAIVPRYSESIEAAKEVIEKMSEQNWYVYINNDDKPKWTVQFERSDGKFLYEGSAAEESLETAICIAALKALESNS